jgi:hypothetical protein
MGGHIFNGSTNAATSAEFIRLFLLACGKHAVDDLILHRYYKHNLFDELEVLRETFTIQDPEKYPTIQSYRDAGVRYMSGHFRNCTGLTIRMPVGVARDRGHWQIPSLQHRSLHVKFGLNARLVIVEHTPNYQSIRVRLAMPREGMMMFTDTNLFTLHFDDYRNMVVTMGRNADGDYVPTKDYRLDVHGVVGVVVRETDRLVLHPTPSMMDAVHASENRY